jgi:hypothetical protein
MSTRGDVDGARPAAGGELRREVLAARRWRRLLGGVVVVQLALLGWLAWPRERVVATTSTHVVAVPTAIEVERVVEVASQRSECPMPRTDAPRTQPTQPAETVGNVKPAKTNAGWIAAWNTTTVFVSRDAGASWRRVLDGSDYVIDVDFDCFGNVLVVRGDRVGVAYTGGEHWSRVPYLMLRDNDPEVGDAYYHRAVASIVGGGPDIAIIGHSRGGPETGWQARLVITSDHAHWRQYELGDGWEGRPAAGRQYPDGSIVAMIPLADCMSDLPWTFELRDGAVKRLDIGMQDGRASLQIWDDVIVAATGWQTLAGDAHDFDDSLATPLPGPAPILRDGDRTFRFVDGLRVPTKIRISEDATSVATDAGGRIWTVICGRVAVATSNTRPCAEGDNDVE